MKKVLFFALVTVFVLGLTSTAFAASPSVINEASSGVSAWTYKDLQDSTPKYEGGYAAYGADADGNGTGDYANPHGGYNTTTNKCKVCHAVHRAEGAYYLLRADSQDDACTYCHVGSAHSTKLVYDLNPADIQTTNGHTIGAQSDIPDSTRRQVAQNVTLSSTDASGEPISEVIKVRSYDSQKNHMYRFARHHGQGVAGTGRDGYMKVGPLALRCMSCHQPHNAVNEVWRPRAFTLFNSSNYSTAVDGDFLAAGYKLLRRYPSGSTTGTVNSNGYYNASQAVKAIEDSAVPGVNFSQNWSAEKTYTENGVTRTQPLWIAQDIHAAEDASGNPVNTGVYRYPNKVNNMALSWWCADCHNLNIGGWEPLADVELGFKAHNERTHPVPYYGSYTGPGQCYSCHRNDLAPQMGLAAASAPDGIQRSTAAYAGRESCTQCHYGTSDYYRERVATTDTVGVFGSDFPHSGKDSSIKLLGSYSVSGNPSGAWSPTYAAATITAGTLDQVCLRCHPGIGFNH